MIKIGDIIMWCRWKTPYIGKVVGFSKTGLPYAQCLTPDSCYFKTVLLVRSDRIKIILKTIFE